MTKRVWLPLLTLVSGLLIGRWSAPSASPNSSTDPDAGAASRAGKAGDRVAADRSSNVFTRTRDEIRRTAPDKVSGLVRNILESVDPAERMALMIEAMQAVDASNVEKVMIAFEDTTRETGRAHGAEFRMAAYVAGQRAGEAVMDNWLERGFQKYIDAAHESFFGWSSKDPAAAEKWLERIKDQYPQEHSRMMKALIGGMAIHNPEEAMAKLEALPGPERFNSIGDLTFHLVQGEGLDRGIDWMLQLNKNVTPENQAFVKAVSDDIYGKLFWAGSGRGGAPEIAERLERIHSVIPLDSSRLTQAVRELNGKEGMELLDRVSGFDFGGKDFGPQINSRTWEVAGKDPAGAIDWLLSHAQSDFAQAQAATVCKVLSARGKTSELRKVLDAMPEEVRQSIEDSSLPQK